MYIGRTREEVGVDNFGKRHVVSKSEVNIAKSYLAIVDLLLFEGSISSKGTTGDNIDFLVGEGFLGFDSVGELIDEGGDYIIKEEDYFVLVAEDALGLLPYYVYIASYVHLSLSKLI